MTDKQLISLLNDTRHEASQYQAIKNELLGLFCINNCPDLTDIWNLAANLFRKDQITIYEVSNVWKGLDEMRKENKCILDIFN